MKGHTDALELFKRAIIFILIALLCLLIAFLLFGIGDSLIKFALDPGDIIDIRSDVLAFIGELLLVVIIIELIDTLQVYRKESVVRVGSVLLVAVTAVSRELIVFDYIKGDVQMLLGIAAAIVAVSVALFLVGRFLKESGEKGTDEGA